MKRLRSDSGRLDKLEPQSFDRLGKAWAANH
jgi:hypothetical protein